MSPNRPPEIGGFRCDTGTDHARPTVVRPCRGVADEAAALFYRRVFELAPEVQALFTNDMTDQGRKLMTVLGAVVRALGEPEQVRSVATRLGSYHAQYCLEPQHYDVVGWAFAVDTAHLAGYSFTAEMEVAWSGAYAVLAATMIGATPSVDS
jgi:nitric oxide dioxygenase